MVNENFFLQEELQFSKDFLKNGFLIRKVENKQYLKNIENLVKNSIKKNKIFKKKVNQDLNLVHNFLSKKNLNEFRVNLINSINNNKTLRSDYYKLAKKHLDAIVGNELVMQKRVNLSIQLPNDDSSLLPVHSDTWSGDSPYEVVLWVPLVDCYKTKSMYILPPNHLKKFHKHFKSKKLSSTELYKKIKSKVKFLNIKFGEILIFNQNLPHGNIVNKESESRWSLNCRFKNIFSPYGDKKIGEFFEPITLKPASKIAFNYKYPNET